MGLDGYHWLFPVALCGSGGDCVFFFFDFFFTFFLIMILGGGGGLWKDRIVIFWNL